MIDVLLDTYIFGLLMELIKTSFTLYRFQELKQKSGIDMLSMHPIMKSYLIKKTILWPWFFVTEKNPIERLSECFFKNYGDKDHTYLGSKGLRNFLNDIFRGINRYDNCQPNKLIWKVDKNGPEYQEHINAFGKTNIDLFATIIYAIFQDKYLIHVTWSGKNCLLYNNNISRFELDNCEQITKTDFEKRLFRINSKKAQEFME